MKNERSTITVRTALTLAGVAALTLAVVTACTTEPDPEPATTAAATTAETTTEATTTPSPTPSAIKRDIYTEVVQLRDALTDAGYDCPSWEAHNRVAAAVESGSCTDNDVLSIYRDQTATLDALETLRSTGPATVVMGQNWIVNTGAHNLRMVRDALGGTIING